MPPVDVVSGAVIKFSSVAAVLLPPTRPPNETVFVIASGEFKAKISIEAVLAKFGERITATLRTFEERVFKFTSAPRENPPEAAPLEIVPEPLTNNGVVGVCVPIPTFPAEVTIKSVLEDEPITNCGTLFKSPSPLMEN